MAFIVFHPEQELKLIRRRQPIVTLSRGAIKLNKMALDKLNSDTVEVAYDPELQLIRLRAAKKGFPIEKKKISGRAFFKHFNIDVLGKFPARYDEKGQCLLVDIGTNEEG
ncbi:MAG: hypothetical protein QMC81_01610 [Thermoanaerobacterales bacterium]|nr:hypothetical protein [Thermoanaerobacterales bacterium]